MIVTGFTTISEESLLTVIDDDIKEAISKNIGSVMPIVSKASNVIIRIDDLYYLWKTKEEIENIRNVLVYNYVIIPFSDMKISVLEDYEKYLKKTGKEENPVTLAEYLQTDFNEEINYNIIIDWNR